MSHLEIKNLQLHNYNLNMQINNNQVIGVFSKDAQLVKEFLEIISGVNPSNNTVFFNNVDVFNNKEYFKNRLYFDFTRKYLSTLKTKYIEERLQHKYNLSFNKEKFAKICKDLDVRGETDITYVYKFTHSGNTFVNFALALSIDTQNVIINNPTKHLNMVTDINYISDKLGKKDNYNSVILGLDNLRALSYLLDKVVLFADEALVIDPNVDSLMLFKKENSYLKNIIYKQPNIITLNTYTKEDLKIFIKEKIEYKKISIYDLESFIYGGI